MSGLAVYYAALAAAVVALGVPLFRAWRASRAVERDDD